MNEQYYHEDDPSDARLRRQVREAILSNAHDTGRLIVEALEAAIRGPDRGVYPRYARLICALPRLAGDPRWHASPWGW